MAHPGKRFLVIQLARFGDLMQSKRLIATLASRGEVHLALDRSLAPLARLVYPHVTLHAIRAHGGGKSASDPAAFLDDLEEIRSLARAGFSRVYNLNFSGLNFALARLFEPERVRGYISIGGQPAKNGLTALAFRYTARRRVSGVNLVDAWAHLARDPAAPETVNPAAGPGGKGLGVVLAGRHARRSLPPEIYAPVVHAIWNSQGRGDIFLLGSGSERRYARELKTHLPRMVLDKTRDLTGRTDWAGLIGAMSGLDAVVTPDTGTMHLAAHLGVPVIATFLSSAWCFETGPYGAGHTVWQATLACAPCLEKDGCPRDVECLKPFAGREFLAALAKGEAPRGLAGLCGYHTGFDPLGVVYAPFAGEDAAREERDGFRAFLAAHLGVEGLGQGWDRHLAEAVYLERDWMAETPGEERMEAVNG